MEIYHALKASHCLTLTLVFSGKIDLLDQSFLQAALYEWLQTHPCPKFVKRFFEESAIRDAKYDEYLLSNTHKLLRRLKSAKV